MKIVTTTIARNEADILEAFVRHHLPFVDRMVIVCHFCQDSSVDVLRALEHEGLPLELHELDDPAFVENEFHDFLFDAAAVHDPDWILPLDADEFLIGTDSGGVEAAFAALPEDRVSQLRWRTYVPRPDDDPEEQNVLERIRWRVEREWGVKVVVPRALRRRRRIGVSHGHHHVYERDTGAALPHGQSDALVLAHYPIRSAKQFRGKVLGGWPTRRAAPRFTPGNAFHTELVFAEMVEAPPSAERLEELARTYALRPQDRAEEALIFDPLPVGFGLRHPVEVASPEEILAGTTMGIAASLSAARDRLERSPSERLRRLPDQIRSIPAKAGRVLRERRSVRRP